MSGFEKTGIFYYNQIKFSDVEFAPSYVTDRSMENDKNEPQPSTSSSSASFPPLQSNTQPSLSPDPQQPTSYDAEVDTGETLVDPQGVFSPEALRPLPKAGPRKSELLF
ncbi:hypothetical protein HHI36_008271 [Cryptolaemus montrouzieri]|uniref:Uncharacterized protein n=1 Tax=Cryptolaemus montrouzieri TaxID=559131 RepID=A0ABD2MS40_9CUCU